MKDVSLWVQVFDRAFTLFLMLDPIGAIGPIVGLIKPYDTQTQKKILRREMFAALIILLVFHWVGAAFLATLGVSQSSVEVAGGVIFLTFAMFLLFPSNAPVSVDQPRREPFLVPIAIPIIAGPSSLATIILYSHQSIPTLIVVSAIVLAWLASLVIILLAPTLFRFLGPTGVRVCEQLIGLLCVLIAIKMILHGITTYFATP